MNWLVRVIAIAVLACSWTPVAMAQSGEVRFELGVRLTSAISTEFDRSDVGVGGRFSWHPAQRIGMEAEIDHYPGDFPDQRPFQSRSQAS